MNYIKKNFTKKFQENLFPGYSSTSQNSSIYSLLYHLAICSIIGDDKATETCRARLEQDLDKNGLLHEQSYAIGKGHSLEYVSLHMSSIFYHFFGFSDPLLKENCLNYLNDNYNVTTSLDSHCFDNAWSVSNELMAIGTLLARTENPVEKSESKKLCKLLIQHPSFCNGLWVSGKPSFQSIINSAAATFHYLPLFLYVGALIPGARRYISVAKGLSMRNGFFSAPDGYACIDYDVVYMIFYCVFNFRDDLSEEEIDWVNNTLTKCLSRLGESQNRDGGFAEYGSGTSAIIAASNSFNCLLRNHCLRSFIWNVKKIIRQTVFKDRITYSNSAINCGSKMNESNIFATWFRLLTVETIEVTLGLINAPEKIRYKANYDRAPGLGYMPLFVKHTLSTID